MPSARIEPIIIQRKQKKIISNRGKEKIIEREFLLSIAHFNHITNKFLVHKKDVLILEISCILKSYNDLANGVTHEIYQILF